jgi:DNA primase
MISEKTIEEVKAIPIEDIAKEYIPDLKRKGANYTGCCPIHGEKTPSFAISPVKGIYKCFGCGAAGTNCVDFLMAVEKGLSYPDAIKRIAEKNGIPVEETNDKQFEELRRRNDDYSTVTRGALAHYTRQLHNRPDMITQILHDRQISRDTLLEFQLGYAPDEFKFLTNGIIKAGYYEPAHKLGIVQTKNDTNYDFFRNRVMIPIVNNKGICVGFGGRKFEDGKKDNPKYLNSSETKGFFDKGKILFGMHLARKAMAEHEYAILVEGYWDVISFHDKGFDNTVATMGTALTDDQVKQLASVTGSVLIARDGDAAGYKSALEAVDKIVAEGLEARYLQMPAGVDPDSLIKWIAWFRHDTYNNIPHITTEHDLAFYIAASSQDAVVWKLDLLMQGADTPTKTGLAIEAATQLIGLVKKDVIRQQYILHCKKQYGIAIKVVKPKEEVLDLSEKQIHQKLAHLKWLTKEKKEEAFETYGFTTCEEPHQFGYWFGAPGFNIEQLTNFIINPLFSVNEPVEKFELAEIKNKYGSKILEVPAGTFTSMNAFEKLIWEARATVLNNFSQLHLRKLNAINIHKFKEATLVRTLGMQPEGFWSFADAIFDKGKIVRYDKTGIAELNKVCFYSPGSAEHNRNKRKDEFGNEVTDGDPYRNDKFLNYTPAAATFAQWAQQMVKVFGPKGMNAVSTVILAVFKDIITAFEKLPIPYGWGDAEAGKSVWAERIFYFFYNQEAKPFNLNSGTIFTFFNTLERFKNCVFLFNEFDEDTINDEFFRAFKQAHDGEGRNKGMMGTTVKNKSTEQPVNVVPILVGQILSTKDGGSVLSRCVPEKFVARTYTDEEKEALDVLKRWEKKGMNGAICELLVHRAQFRRDFFPVFNQLLSRMKTDIQRDGGVYKERIARNHCIMLACSQIISEHFNLGYDMETYYNYMVGSVLNLTEMVNENNSLGVFWKELTFMFEQQLIEEGFDYKIITANEIKVTVTQEGRKVDIIKKFEQPKKLLLLRLSSIFPLFEERIKRSTGTKSINQKTLTTYFESNKAFYGNNPTSHYSSKSKNIKDLKTSAYVFDYEALKINLESAGAADDDRKLETITGKVTGHPERVKLGGDQEAVKFRLVHYIQTGKPPKTVTLITNVFCPSALDPGVMNEDVVTVKGYVTETVTGSGDYRKTVRSLDATQVNKGESAGDNAENAEKPDENEEFSLF